MKSRIEEALETADALMALTKMDTLSMQERMAVLGEFAKRRARVRSDIRYLAENLHASDPRRKAAESLLKIVEKIDV